MVNPPSFSRSETRGAASRRLALLVNTARLAGAAGLGAVAVLLSACGGSPAEDACSDLAGQAFGEGVVDGAELVSAANGVGEHCQVTGSIDTALRFQINLPVEWNKKLVFGGGGGWDGTIPSPPTTVSSSGNTGGYVTVFSNGGHESESALAVLDASFALDNPQGREDFAYRSSHAVLEVARQIVSSHYGAEPERSYFEGCSNGGREALMQATRYPEDYDGIVVRAPAYDFTYLFLAFLDNAKRGRAPGGALDQAKMKLLADAALAQCDALDGVKDGIISHAAACAVDLEPLRCEAGEGCLTDAQMDTASALYTEYKWSNGEAYYPGWGHGGEDDPAGLPLWLGTAPGGLAFQPALAEGLVKYWLLEDPGADAFAFVPEDHEELIEEAAAMLDATPDLGAFFEQGRKLILAHGTSDWAISYRGSIAYFDAVAGAVGGADVRDASMELFLLPGTQHCGGGSGADTVDLLESVAKWTESGQRPSEQGLVAEKLDAGGARVLSRPLCMYPKFPKYQGSGDPDAAASFTCAEP